MNDRQTITFWDFGGFVIMACLFVWIFVVPFITAAAYMDHERSWRAIPSPVSTGSERSDLRTSSPSFGAVQVAGSHGVGRVLGPVSWLPAPGLAQQSHRPIRPQSSAGLDRDGSLRPDEAGAQGGVRPVLSPNSCTDAADRACVNSVQPCNGNIRLYAASDVRHLIRCDFDSDRGPLLGMHVSHVVRMSPEKQVSRVDAVSDIALMKHGESRSYGAVCEFPRNSVRRDLVPVNIKVTIPATLRCSEPQPTFLGSLYSYLRPESLPKIGFSHIAPPSAIGQGSGLGLAPLRSPNYSASNAVTVTWIASAFRGPVRRSHVVGRVPAALRGTDAAGSTLYEVTAYAHGCTMPRSGRERPAQRGADGRWPEAGVTVAADAALHPFGTELLIAGLGFRTVGDRGHAIKGRRLDLFMASCEEARAYGRRWVDVVPVPAQSVRYASLGGAQ